MKKIAKIILGFLLITNLAFPGPGENVSSVGSLSSVKSLAITSPVSGQSLKAGGQGVIGWTADNLANVKIEYSTDNGVNWVDPPIVASVAANILSYTWSSIPSAVYTTCKIRISEIGGSMTSTSSTFPTFLYSQSFSANTTITFNDPTKETSYRLVGLPGVYNNSISQFIVSGNRQTDWNAYRDNGVVSTNKTDYLIEYDGTSNFNFKAGVGFWVLSKNGLQVTGQVNAVSLAADNSYEIALQPNWNIISNPFVKSVNWAAVLAANPVLPSNTAIYTWNGGWNSSPISLLPYNGYYVKNTTALTKLKIIYNPDGNFSKTGSENKVDLFSNSDLLLSLTGNNVSFGKIGIGFSNKASNDYDTIDYLAPPGGFEEAGIRIINDSLAAGFQQLMIERCYEVGEGKQFNLQVINRTNKPLTLKTDGLDNFQGYEVYLMNKNISKLYNLKKNGNVIISGNKKLADFNLLIGSSKFIESVKAGLVPDEFVLRQNYPNPFNPTTIISYDIPETGNVLLKVYDVLGQEVKVLVNEEQKPGRYEVDFGNSSMSSGIYFYNICVGSFTSTKKMLLIK